MKITIIETGLAPAAIRNDFPTYPEMFEALIGGADEGLSFETVRLELGDNLPDPESLDGILITGSAHGVYDPVPWMTSLMEFIGWAAEKRVPQAGLCFGHQVMAKALGAHVAKSDKGWGIGRHTYDVPHRPAWMSDAPDRITFGVSHQDQVLSLPPGARVTATNEFCQFAGLEYTHAPAMSFQGHPEFSDDFFTALYRARQGNPLEPTAVATAVKSLEEEHHNENAGRWLADFYRSNSRQ